MSKFTLPFTVVYAVVILFAGGIIQNESWWQAGCLTITTFLMVLLNNNNSLIRVYSRLVSCTFLVLSLMCPVLGTSLSGSISQILFVAMLLFLCSAYQDRYSMGKVFYAFVCLGGISTQFSQIAFFIPFIWILLATNILAGTFRSYIASILGFITPYWFWAAYSLYIGDFSLLLEHINTFIAFEPICGGLLDLPMLMPVVFLMLLGIIGTIHFTRNSYADSIKTRMLFTIFIVLFFLTMVFLILQPQHSDYLLRIAFICVAPLVAHYFTFTSTWFTNMSFYLATLIVLAITILNTWIL